MLAKKLESAAKAVEPAYIEDVFSTYLYTGNSSTQTIINGIDLAGKGGMVWLKSRSGADPHELTNTVQGPSNSLRSNSSNGASSTDLTGFTSSGFTLGYVSGNTNISGAKEVSWTFREQPKFFDVVTGTCDGSGNITVNHSLGSVPGFVTIKRTDGASAWLAYHTSLGNNQYVYLNATNAAATLSSIWNATSTTFTANVGFAAGAQVVLYLFAHNAGGFGLTGNDNVISCGSYTGSNNPSYPSPGAGRTVTLGYEPQFVMIKNITTGSMNWVIMDNMRQFDLTSYGWIFPNTSGAEQIGTTDVYCSPTSTGFRTYGNNATVDGGSTSETFIYIAIRRGPMRTPTTGTSVFTPVSRAGTNAAATTTGLGFPPDLVISKNRTTTYVPAFFDRLRGPLLALRSSGTNAESSASLSLMSFNQDGLSLEADASLAAINFSGTYSNWNFRRAPGFFDEVCYTGTGAAGLSVSHNLTVPPEMVIVKRRDSTGDWPVLMRNVDRLGSAGSSYRVNSTASWDPAGSYFSDSSGTFVPATDATSTVFKVSNAPAVNASAGTYVAYLFASCPGVSKVGSYTGNGSSQTINCGFTGGARFVLIKRTDSTGDWYVWDTARGIVAGNDPHLSLNTTDAEVTTDDTIDPDSTGFIVNQLAATNVNVSSATYIYLAIA